MHPIFTILERKTFYFQCNSASLILQSFKNSEKLYTLMRRIHVPSISYLKFKKLNLKQVITKIYLLEII